MKYILTDGIEVFKTQNMTAWQYTEASIKAFIATDGNVCWVPGPKSPRREIMEDLYKEHGLIGKDLRDATREMERLEQQYLGAEA